MRVIQKVLSRKVWVKKVPLMHQKAMQSWTNFFLTFNIFSELVHERLLKFLQLWNVILQAVLMHSFELCGNAFVEVIERFKLLATWTLFECAANRWKLREVLQIRRTCQHFLFPFLEQMDHWCLSMRSRSVMEKNRTVLSGFVFIFFDRRSLWKRIHR